MAETVGEAYVKIVTDSRGMRRGVEEALAEAGQGADKAGKQAGEDFGDAFAEGAEDRLKRADVGSALGEDLRDNIDKLLQGSLQDLDRQIEELHRLGEADRDLIRRTEEAARSQRDLTDSVRETNNERRRFDLSRLTGQLRDFGREALNAGREGRQMGLRDIDTDVRRASVHFPGLLGHFQDFGRFLRTASIDIRNWRQGLLAAGDTVLGFGKSVYKAALLLGPLAGGLSAVAGIATAFAGALQTGIIGGLAALGPLAVAAGAGMFALSIGMQAFGKHATDAQQKAVAPLVKQFTALKTAVSGAVLGNVDQQAKLLVPVMGQLQAAMVGVGGAVSNTVTQLLRVVGPGGQAGDSFTKLTGSLTTLTTKLGSALTNTLSGFVGLLAAAVPVSTRFANALIGLTSRFAAFANSTKGQAELAGYFDRGYNAAAKIMTILGRLGTALFKVFNIGDQSGGEAMLDTLLAKVTEFNNYVSSARGIQELKGWFADARVAAINLGGAFKALGTAFGALDTGQTRTQFSQLVDFAARLVTGFANIVTQTQNLTSPMSTLGSSASDAWSSIKQLASTVADLYQTISESGADTVLSTGLNLLGAAAGVANAALSALKPLIDGLVAAFSALPGPIQSAAAALLLMSRTGITAGITGLVTKISAIGPAAAGAAARAGIISRIGGFAATTARAFGPVGLAIGAVALGLGILSSRQKDAARAAAEHKAEVDALFKSMQASGGVMNGQVKATAANIIAQKGLLTTAKSLGVSEQTALGIALGSTKARQQLGAAINKQQQAAEKLSNTYGATGNAEQSSRNELQKNTTQAAQNRDKMLALQGALTGVNKSLTDAQSKWLATAQAQSLLQNATAAVNPLIQDLTKQMQTFADTTQSATSRTDAFSNALLELDDKSMSTQQAQIKAAEAARQLQQTFGKTRDAAGNVTKAQFNLRSAFITGTTSLNTQSKAAAQLDQMLRTQITPAFSDVVRAAFDAAGGVKNLGPATAAAAAAADKYDTSLTKQLVSMGLTTAQAKALEQQYHLMPSDVSTILKLVGGKATEAEMQAIIDKSKDVSKNPATVKLAADATNGERTITAYQARINAIRQGKVPGLAANSAAGRATVSDLQHKIDAIRQKTATALRANPAAATAVATALQQRLNRILQTHPTALKANSDPAHNTAVALQAEINRMKAIINVGADLSAANADVSNWHPPDRIVKVSAAIGKQYSAGNYMAGGLINRPTFANLGELGKREAVVPLDLPLNRVSPEVRGMAALLRGQGQSTASTVTAQRVSHNTVNVYPQAADPEAVSWSLLNKLTVLGR